MAHLREKFTFCPIGAVGLVARLPHLLLGCPAVFQFAFQCRPQTVEHLSEPVRFARTARRDTHPHPVCCRTGERIRVPAQRYDVQPHQQPQHSRDEHQRTQQAENLHLGGGMTSGSRACDFVFQTIRGLLPEQLDGRHNFILGPLIRRIVQDSTGGFALLRGRERCICARKRCFRNTGDVMVQRLVRKIICILPCRGENQVHGTGLGVDEQIRAALGLRQMRGFFIRQRIVFQCLDHFVALSCRKNLGPVVVQMGDVLGFRVGADLICQQVGRIGKLLSQRNERCQLILRLRLLLHAVRHVAIAAQQNAEHRRKRTK